jgi:hypothetical protein
VKRREFMALLGGAAVSSPLAARAQQPERMRRVGVLAAHERHVPEFDGLREQLRELGYCRGEKSSHRVALRCHLSINRYIVRT